MKLKRIGASVLVCIVFTAAVAWGQVTAHYINVGQAASALIEFKSGAILIDAGGEATADDVYGDHLVAYLNKFFERRADLHQTLDGIIISHPHIDHTKYLMNVFDKFTVRALVDNGGDSGSGISQLKKARKFVQDHDLEYIAVNDASIRRSGKKLSLITGAGAPTITLLSGLRGCSNKNNDSIAVRIVTVEATFLFVGDAENEADDDCDAELDLLEQRFHDNGLLDADVYHVPHHGSFNGTSDDFMVMVSPKISVISAGDPDRQTPGQFHAFQFGHPREVAVDTIEKDTSGTRASKMVVVLPKVKKTVTHNMTKAVYCTCWDGDVVIAYKAGQTTPTIKTDENSVPRLGP